MVKTGFLIVKPVDKIFYIICELEHFTAFV